MRRGRHWSINIGLRAWMLTQTVPLTLPFFLKPDTLASWHQIPANLPDNHATFGISETTC